MLIVCTCQDVRRTRLTPPNSAFSPSSPSKPVCCCDDWTRSFASAVGESVISGKPMISAFQQGTVELSQTAFGPEAQSPCATCRNGGCMQPLGVACNPRTNQGTRVRNRLSAPVRISPALERVSMLTGGRDWITGISRVRSLTKFGWI